MQARYTNSQHAFHGQEFGYGQYLFHTQSGSVSTVVLKRLHRDTFFRMALFSEVISWLEVILGTILTWS